MKAIYRGAVALLVVAAAGAAWGGEGTAGIDDRTTQHRELVRAVRPVYPPGEQGRWTPSCVSLYFTIRPDGQTDEFVVLEAPQYKHPGASNLQTDAEKLAESRVERQFIQSDLEALYNWRYAKGDRPVDEIVAFNWTRSAMGGHLMNLAIRRLDLGTPEPKACGDVLDPKQVHDIVAKARGKK